MNKQSHKKSAKLNADKKYNLKIRFLLVILFVLLLISERTCENARALGYPASYIIFTSGQITSFNIIFLILDVILAACFGALWIKILPHTSNKYISAVDKSLFLVLVVFLLINIPAIAQLSFQTNKITSPLWLDKTVSNIFLSTIFLPAILQNIVQEMPFLHNSVTNTIQSAKYLFPTSDFFQKEADNTHNNAANTIQTNNGDNMSDDLRDEDSLLNNNENTTSTKLSFGNTQNQSNWIAEDSGHRVYISISMILVFIFLFLVIVSFNAITNRIKTKK